jgi:alpha-glucosidase
MMNEISGLLHHDGSGLYVSNDSPQLGDVVSVRMRAPKEMELEKVFLRTVHDGEPKLVAARLEKHSYENWWVADLTVRNPRTHYRWLLTGPSVPYAWLTAGGVVFHDTADCSDFVVHASPAPPAWLQSAVVYQVFPDRFATSKLSVAAPTWAVPRSWSTHPEGRSKNTAFEYFGGDLLGIADHLDHLIELGVTVLYMTPFFPANSTHRYDASTFASVDPLLGGDDALAALIEKAHALGIKVMGDITLNHCGAEHEWFKAALAGEMPYRDFFTFDDALEHGYECWLGVKSLPKFNYESPELIDRLISGENSVLRQWLRFGLDGWRVDVANMSGRQGALDVTHEVARLARRAVESAGLDKALIAEHFHDAGPDLDGDGWHGAMNYGAFMNPVWTWLRSDAFDGNWQGIPVRTPSQPGQRMVSAITSFASRMPWRSYAFSWPLLGSHDTARIRTLCGSRERHIAALALLMTLPGTPMIFAGDEIGAEGAWGEDSRTTFPWDDRSTWDEEIFAAYKSLISVRKDSEALLAGGLRWIHVSEDLLVYLRESGDQRILVAVSRSPHEPVSLSLKDLHTSRMEPLFGGVLQDDDMITIDFQKAGALICELV